MSSLADTDTFFASDIHWQPADGDAESPTGLFGHFLSELADRARAGRPAQLFVIGDLFDFWIERGPKIFPVFRPHVEALRRATEAGVKISLLFGNRDFTYRGALPSLCGIEIIGDRAETELDGKKILMQHGDLFCANDTRYQLYRRFIRSAPIRWAIRALPFSWMTKIVAWMRDASRAEIKRKRPSSMELSDRLIAAEHQKGFNLVICGHLHRPEVRKVEGAPDDSRLITLGAWDPKLGWYAASLDGEIKLFRYTT